MAPETISSEAVRECLERTAPGLFAGESHIVGVHPSRFEAITSYDAWRLDVRLGGGGELQLFLKDFGVSVRRKNDPRERREREVAVYRELLADAPLGTARYYGSVMDDAQGRFWMLLEYVDGTPVGYGPLGDGWAPGAEALGRMHGYFATRQERLRACDFLIRLTPEFFHAAAARALVDVSTVAPHLLGRLERLVRGYGPIVERMTAQPATLVQGGCRSSNILIGIASDPRRSCILDWEEASFGPALFDVAHLLDGIKAPLLDRLLEAYRAGAEQYGMTLSPPEEMKYDIECFRLHMAFNMLGRAVLKGYNESGILKLLDYAERIGEVVYGPGRDPGSIAARDGDDELRPQVARWLTDALGHDIDIAGWRREASPVAVPGVSPIETLRVSMRGGDERTLFVKHPGAAQADHPDKQSHEREWRLYEEWLRADDLPVPRYYGSRRDGHSGRRELYLEYLPDWSLKYQALDHWFAAAPELARLHARFAKRALELEARDYLLRLDAAYFRAWAERARTAIGTDSEALATGLAEVIAVHGQVAELLARQPRTLVHNDLAPKNVLVDRTRRPTRICFVDWEMAGVGCGALDLVHLCHGLDPASARAMREAYGAALEGSGLLPADPRERDRLFAACELHGALYRIANSHLWRLPPERVAEWVAEARELSRRFAAEPVA